MRFWWPLALKKKSRFLTHQKSTTKAHYKDPERRPNLLFCENKKGAFCYSTPTTKEKNNDKNNSLKQEPFQSHLLNCWL